MHEKESTDNGQRQTAYTTQLLVLLLTATQAQARLACWYLYHNEMQTRCIMQMAMPAMTFTVFCVSTQTS